MDLRDLVREDISSVASIFAFKSFGGLIGILGPGLLLDRQAGYNTDGDSPISNIHKHCNTTQGVVMKYLMLPWPGSGPARSSCSWRPPTA